MSGSFYKFYVKTSNYIIKSPACKAVLNCVYPLVKPLIYKSNTFSISTADFLFLQHKKGIFIRPDMIVRYMFLEHYYKTPDYCEEAVDMYIKMMDYRNINTTGEQKVEKFHKLIASCEKNGFNPSFPVEVDKNLLIRDGSHRTSMALFLGTEEINVHRTNQNLPVEYKADLFEKTGFTEKELQLIEAKKAQLFDRYNTPFAIVLFDADEAYEDSLANSLAEYGNVVSRDRYSCCAEDFGAVASKLGKINSKAGKASTSGGQHTVSVIMLKLEKPEYAPLDNPKNPVVSQTVKIDKMLKTSSFGGNCAMAYISENFGQNIKAVKELSRFFR